MQLIRTAGKYAIASFVTLLLSGCFMADRMNPHSLRFVVYALGLWFAVGTVIMLLCLAVTFCFPDPEGG